MDGVGSPSMNALQADVLPAAENFARDANFLNVPGMDANSGGPPGPLGLSIA